MNTSNTNAEIEDAVHYGDALLCLMAKTIRDNVRAIDTIARLGGDEFAILLDNLSDLPEAEQVAERIRHEFTLPLSLGGHQIFTTASIGIVRGSPKYQRPNDLLRDADTAMYQAKAKGKARHALFETAQHTRVMDRWRLETDLWQAIKEWHEFEVYYQPILSLTTYQIIGVEAVLLDLLDPADLAKEVTGENLTVKPFIGYLEKKFGKIYGF